MLIVLRLARAHLKNTVNIEVIMKQRLLLLGSTGKMGTAISQVFAQNYEIISKSSKDFDAAKPEQAQALIHELKPDIVINTVAFMGIDPCEKNRSMAETINSKYPTLLAESCHQQGILFVHFTTDAVFNGAKGSAYVESDPAAPLNFYGASKHAADLLISSRCPKHYLIRLPVIFGPSRADQFVEKMLLRAKNGNPLRVADDVIGSPSYTIDIVTALKAMIEEQKPYGLYHLANEGQASLYDLMKECLEQAKIDVPLSRASHLDFPSVGIKNTFTPMTSEKIAPLRPWREAVACFIQHWIAERS